MKQLEQNKYQLKAFHKDFIGIYEDIVPKEKCEEIIQQMNFHMETNPSEIRNGKEQLSIADLARKDYQIFANKVFGDISKYINQNILDICIQAYIDEFFVLKSIKGIRSDEIKLQMTPPRGGFHIWHCEQFNKESSSRILVWTIYLNDIPDGEGETEFLWQGIRVKPKAGTVCIFPAAFTHTHRGNPVYSCDKYIATGWYTFNE